MATGSWDPATKTVHSNTTIDPELIRRFLALAEAEQLDDLNTAIDAADKQAHGIMQADQDEWNKVMEEYTEAQLLALIRFFTLVEEQLSHWVGGAKSPVIAINNILKHRGIKLDKEMLLWIRKNSSNRFIPNGAVL